MEDVQDVGDVILAEFGGLADRVQLGLDANRLGDGGTDPIDVLQGDHRLLVVRDVDTEDSWHFRVFLTFFVRQPS